MTFKLKNNAHLSVIATFLLMFLGLSAPMIASADNMYRVNVKIYHLGELVAQPEMDVIADRTRGGTYKLEDNSQYRFVVLVREQTSEQLYVSLQYSAGKINIQPDLMVKVGEEVSATIDKVRLTMVVSALKETKEGELIAHNE